MTQNDGGRQRDEGDRLLLLSALRDVKRDVGMRCVDTIEGLRPTEDSQDGVYGSVVQ